MSEVAVDGNVWIIDPLDGTTNFVNAIPQVAVSLALLVDGVRSVGVVYDVARDEMFSAVIGQGATVNGKPIHAGGKEMLREAVIATGAPYDRERFGKRLWSTYQVFLEKSRDLRRFGAAALDQCWVACGRFDGYFEYGLSPWDVAGGSLIVEEAGGRVGNFEEQEPETFSIFSDSFLFASPKLFYQMLQVARDTVGIS